MCDDRSKQGKKSRTDARRTSLASSQRSNRRLGEVKKWHGRKPDQRQRILDPATLDVDDSGDIDLSKMPTVAGFDAAQGRSRWWGEIHWESYGQLLYTLEHNLNSTFSLVYSQGGW